MANAIADMYADDAKAPVFYNFKCTEGLTGLDIDELNTFLQVKTSHQEMNPSCFVDHPTPPHAHAHTHVLLCRVIAVAT